MRKLMKVKLINFHYFVNQTIDLDGLPTVITGDTGAGKSTIVDALQIVFLGDLRKIKFNTSAHEHKTERSLLSYLRGKVGTVEKEFLRNTDFTSYIVIEIAHQTNRGNVPYLVGAVFDYQHSTQTESHSFFNISNVPLNDNLFLNNNTPKTKEEFFRDLKKNKVSHRPFHNDLEGYRSDLKTLLGNVRESFFTLLPKGIAFSPITNLRNFVYEYILDEEPVDVSRMQDFMERLDDLNNLIVRAEKEIFKLNEISQLYNSFTETNTAIFLNKYLITRYEFENANTQKEKHQSEIISAEEQFRENKENIEQLKSQHNNLENTIEKLYEGITSHNSTIKAERLKTEIASINDKIEEINRLMVSLKQGIKTEIRELIKLEQLLILADAPLAYSQSILEAKYGMEQFLDVNAFPENYLDLTNKWSSSYQWLQQHLYTIENEHNNKKQELFELDKIIGQLKNRNILSENSPSMKLKQLLEEHLIPNANDKVFVNILCEVIDVPNDEWKNAVEGYLHTQKFDVLVSPGYFDQALEIYERMKFSHNIERVGLVNTDKLMMNTPVAQAQSLAKEVSSELPYAMAYINQLLGSIIKVTDVNELKRHSRSITPTCMTYSNYTARQIPKKRYETPYIGKNALEIQLTMRESERNALLQQLDRLSNQINELKILRQFSSNKYDKYTQWKTDSDKIDKLTGFEDKVRDLTEKFMALDMKEVELLKQQIRITREHARSVNEELQEKKAHEVRIEKQIEDNQYQLIDWQNKLTIATENLYKFETNYKNTNINELENCWNEEIGKYPFDHIKNNALKKIGEFNEKNKEVWEDLIVERQEYNHSFDISYDVKDENNDKYDNRLFFLENEKIVDYKEKAEEAKEMAHNSFKEDFIAKLKEQIERAEEDFNALNRSLKDMKFGTDKYRFTIGARRDSKMVEYYKMLKDPNLIGQSIFSQSFQEEYRELINELFDSIVRSRELQNYDELLDYRSYLDFELSVTDSQGNTIEYSKVALEKSGGETQVPFYVAILASFYYTYQLFRKTDTFRLVILDEAFNRMDAERVAEAIKFMKSCGFQPIIITPTGSVHMYSLLMKNTLVVLKDNYFSFVAPFSTNEEN